MEIPSDASLSQTLNSRNQSSSERCGRKRSEDISLLVVFRNELILVVVGGEGVLVLYLVVVGVLVPIRGIKALVVTILGGSIGIKAPAFVVLAVLHTGKGQMAPSMFAVISSSILLLQKLTNRWP